MINCWDRIGFLCKDANTTKINLFPFMTIPIFNTQTHQWLLKLYLRKRIIFNIIVHVVWYDTSIYNIKNMLNLSNYKIGRWCFTCISMENQILSLKHLFWLIFFLSIIHSWIHFIAVMLGGNERSKMHQSLFTFYQV